MGRGIGVVISTTIPPKGGMALSGKIVYIVYGNGYFLQGMDWEPAEDSHG